jgi:hypothetical protein
MERSTSVNGKIHYKWPFSIAMFDITRGYIRTMVESLVLDPRLVTSVVELRWFGWHLGTMIPMGLLDVSGFAAFKSLNIMDMAEL